MTDMSRGRSCSAPRPARGRHRLAAAAAALLVACGLARGAFSQPVPPSGGGGAAAAPPAGEAASGPVSPPVGGPAAAPSHAPSGVGRSSFPAPPDPTPEQLEALAILQSEAESYEREAKDYRTAITRIIKHHYAEQRRRILSALDTEIGTEQKALDDAREEAIRRLEAFVSKYSGPNAHPKNTPDAMFRLAALYEERAKAKIKPGDVTTAIDLSETIAQYKQIVRDFGSYGELAAVFYYLGHSYFSVGRLEEAQQVWRSLVCHNRYPYPVAPDPTDPTRDSIGELPQDHDPDFWIGWTQRHLSPAAPTRGGGNAGAGDETVFLDPFPPEGCEPLPQKTLPGDEPRYLAEVWWQIGDFFFEELDPHAGPYNLNRAESAYRQSLQYKKPPVYGVAMYKLAWTYYKQQRYETAVRQFIDLLAYTDQREQETGDPGADFRNEAYSYIAGSLTYLDFQGPSKDDPYIGRDDIFDIETDPVVIEQKMHVAIDRVQDASLVPQEKRWTVEIYKALANEYKEYNHYHNLIETNELILAKWPLNRDAPKVQNQVADTYQTLADQSPPGPQRDEYSKKALEARGDLAKYVGKTEWTEANKEDPEAIREAEQIVRGGLRRAAADYTNAGSALVQTAISSGDQDVRDQAFEAALDKYRRAAASWRGYLEQDDTADDAYDSSYWLADSLTNVVAIQVALRRMPSDDDFAEATRRAIEVRDSNESNEKLQPAAMMAVKVAQQRVLINYQFFEDSGGAKGFPRLESLETSGQGEERKPVVKEVPPEIEAMLAAFDDYIANVPLEADPYQNHDQFAYTAGETYFFYGQFEQAKRRLNPIHQMQCGKTKYGYFAWEKLITMANLEGDLDRGRELALGAEKQSCAMDEETAAKEKALGGPTIITGFYVDAARAYEKAREMPPGPERDAQFRKAAALYKEALEKAPDHDAAPEAAMNGAFAYKQVGDYDKAIAMYKLFIEAYGNDERLTTLEKGDPKAKPPVPPDPKRYEARVTYLKSAYDELGKSYILFFSYRTAAETFEAVAKNGRFGEEERRDAAKNAVTLYGNIGDRDKLKSTRQLYFDLHPGAEQKAEIDWLVASAELKRWDERSPDKGANKDARVAAQAALEIYYKQNSSNAAANAFTVQAAYQSAKLRRAVQDGSHKDWCKNTIKSFDSYKSSAGNTEGRNNALGTVQADMAAECDYREIDEQIKKSFDYDAGFHRYEGVITDVKQKFKDDVEKEAKSWNDKLQNVITAYGSGKWAVAARARQGSLYDSCRSGLYNAREPGLKLYTDKEDSALKKLDKLCEEDGSEDACTKGDAFRAKRRTDWKTDRDASLAAADRPMSVFYAEAIVWARSWKVHVAGVDLAVRRLAFYTDIIGDAKLHDYLQNLKEPGQNGAPVPYDDGMYLRMRRGMTAEVEGNPLPEPLPVIVP